MEVADWAISTVIDFSKGCECLCVCVCVVCDFFSTLVRQTILGCSFFLHICNKYSKK